LQPGGLFVFSVEAAPETVARHALQYHGRYHHSAGYLQQVLADAGFTGLELVPGVLRQELMRPVHGWIVVGRRPPLEGDSA
jgi:predicted TPR repeat methyltransferase